MALNRLRILDEASRLFREKGFEAVTVSEVMKAAGMTHGGFYGHFQSKDDLIAQMLLRRFAEPDAPMTSVEAFRNAYLSLRHCKDTGDGCVVSALAGEIPRQSVEARQAMAEGIRAQIEVLTEGQTGFDPTLKRREAIGSWSAMVGAIILARAAEDPALAQEILDQTRSWLEAREQNDSPPIQTRSSRKHDA